MKQNIKLKTFITKIIALVVFFTVSTVGITAMKVCAATDEVSLYSQKGQFVDSIGCYSINQLTAIVKVKNIAYEKKVYIHCKDAYSDWKDVEAKYNSKLDDNYELWKVETIFRGGEIEYAIKYEVNGQTYWDNNNGKNYRAHFNTTTIE